MKRRFMHLVAAALGLRIHMMSPRSEVLEND